MLFTDDLKSGAARGKRVLVLGFGIDAGESAARFLSDHGCVVTVADVKSESDFNPETVAALRAKNVIFEFATHAPAGDFDVIVRSPGILGSASSAIYIAEQEKRGVPITSATNIFLALSPGMVVGVTGTKGKGTCASLIYSILKAAGRDVVLGGNIGTPPLDLLQKMSDKTIAVLELSSFQLLDADRSPQIAVVLMTTEDHLDLHASVDEYLAAKSRIVEFQRPDDAVIYNPDYPNTLRIVHSAKSQRYEVSAYHEVRNGCFVDGGDIVFAKGEARKVIASVADVRIPGAHNLENVTAAVMASIVLGILPESIRKGLQSFTGLEHRLEFIREINGVKYYNDSFATNPSSTIAAIKAFSASEVLILGGSPKGSDFSELAEVMLNHGNIRAIVGIGEEWQKIKTAIQKMYGDRPLPKIIEGLTTMPEMVKAAHDAAQPGDIVLLSPACASFGLFTNYKERGEKFKETVNRL